MITIRDLTTAAELDAFAPQQPFAPFLQSWAWGDFQQRLGRRIRRRGAYRGDQLVGAALIIEHQLMLGRSYFYCPRGPLASAPDVFRAMTQDIADIARQAGVMYAKVEPGIYAFPLQSDSFPSEYQPGSTLQPRTTLTIDVTLSVEALLAAMHQKTRYNVRLAEKKGVRVRWSTEDKDMDHFLSLMHATYQRQGIRPHSDQYYRVMFSVLRESQMAELAIAEHDGQVLAANMLVWHQPCVTYVHGGSSDDHKELMAPYLVQWQTILRAKEREYTTYDLWGAAPAGAVGHRWSGVTRFKEGFGGQRVEFPLAANVVIDPPWYHAYRLVKRMRGGVDG